MAALQVIRGRAGLLIGVLGVALLAFILSDFFTSGNAFFNKFKDNAFAVNGDVVSTGKYTDRVEEREFFEKVMSNKSNLDEATMSQIREVVYQQMVKEMMLDEQSEALGLAVTPEELSDMVYGENVSPMLARLPIFVDPQTGRFEKAYLVEFLTDINKDPSALSPQQQQDLLTRKKLWATIEGMLKYQRLEEKYASLVAGTVLVNDAEAKAAYTDSKNVASIAYVVEKYTSLSDSSVTVSDAELKALYDLRKNSFKIDSELRKISYFIKDMIPSEDDYAAVKAEMDEGAEKLATTDNPALVVAGFSGNQYIDTYIAVSALPAEAKAFVESASIGQIYGPVRDNQSFIMYKLVDKTIAPDSIKLQIIPLPQGLEFNAANAIADSLLNVIKGGKEFAVVANEIMPGSNGGELPMIDEMSLARAGVPKECFEAAKGEVLKIAINGETQLVRVAGKSNPVPKVKLAVVQLPVVVSDKTQSAIDNELNQFISENGNLENFNKAAQAKGYSIVPDALISPSEIALNQTAGTRQVIHWAFNEKVGTVKKFDMSDKRIIAIIAGEINDDYLPLSELRKGLEAELIRDKKAEKIIADLKAKNLTSLDAYADAVAGKVDTVKFVTFQTGDIAGPGYEPVLNIYSKIGQTGKLEGPVKGRAGVYAINVVEKTESPTEYNSTQIKQFLRQNSYYQLMSGALQALQGKMDVKDNRVKFW
ncbi:peptidylprolyl isomerase [Dysgonomonas sp. ZJ709]|uniref:peptidylprolyl isomerase n=1 Tax=Dysgonomonas sp. ZJ709 TaxID=2709797 RepID=UPI0013ECE123|nr:peptidylprolyl isomerase [Dysgonomonas sp. ZJ709]